MKEEYRFENQRPDEDVIFVQKKHPWVLSKGFFIIIVLIAFLVISIVIWGFSAISSFIIFAVVLISGFFSWYLWFTYSNSVSILTSQRIIIIDQGGLFSKKITESELDKIQNILIEIKGMSQTLLNFGNIKITAAGNEPIMIIENVENPYDLQQEIIKNSRNIELNRTKNSNQNIIR